MLYQWALVSKESESDVNDVDERVLHIVDPFSILSLLMLYPNKDEVLPLRLLIAGVYFITLSQSKQVISLRLKNEQIGTIQVFAPQYNLNKRV